MTLFCDRNLATKLPEALKLLGLPVEKHDDHFGKRATDEELLSELGAREWVMVTEDVKLTKRESALTALADHGTRCFVLVGAGSRPRWHAVRILAYNWDALEQLVATEAPPFLYKLYIRSKATRVALPGC